jgi:hypothetical protein
MSRIAAKIETDFETKPETKRVHGLYRNEFNDVLVWYSIPLVFYGECAVFIKPESGLYMSLCDT